MALKLIQCPNCGYKFRFDIEKSKENGEIKVPRGYFHTSKSRPMRFETLDLKCPNCKHRFEQEYE
jgi:DNA-directed RNA polymerase subunit RPC12/RpoP